MTMRHTNGQPARRFDDLRCSAMAITTMTIFVGSFWLAGILY